MDVVQSQRNMRRSRTKSISQHDSVGVPTSTSNQHDKNRMITSEGAIVVSGQQQMNCTNNNHNSNNNNDTFIRKMTTTTTGGRGSNGSVVTRPGPFARFRAGARLKRSSSAPAAPGGRRRRRRKLLMEDHYNVTTTAVIKKGSGKHPETKIIERPIVLPGVPQHDPDWSRDSHDFFNLIVLIPVVALNIMNWDWDKFLWWLLGKRQHHHQQHHHQQENGGGGGGGDISFREAWTGEWFEVFFFVTTAYFVIDLIWILLVPSCVKSPSTIIQHHVATLFYLMLPYLYPELQWCMGACMIVEVNTWFLIARRVFNRQGFPPWRIDLGSFASIRVKLISVFFYLTWIAIRCILYPYLLPLFYHQWITHSKKVGTYWNLIATSVPLHALFCLLNLKWTYDLFTSKIRFWTRNRNNNNHNNKNTKTSVDKGL